MKPSEEPLLLPRVLWLLGVLVFQVSDQPAWKRQRVQEFDAVFPNGLSNSQPAKMSQGSWRFWEKDRKRDLTVGNWLKILRSEPKATMGFKSLQFVGGEACLLRARC